jgi:hypothetical protein
MTAAAGVPFRHGPPKSPRRQDEEDRAISAAQTEALRSRLTVDQPPRTVPKHRPMNTHVPGSIAYAVAGGRVIR